MNPSKLVDTKSLESGFKTLLTPEDAKNIPDDTGTNSNDLKSEFMGQSNSCAQCGAPMDDSVSSLPGADLCVVCIFMMAFQNM